METNAQHYTNASFHKTLYTLGKICATSDKTTTTKTTSRKKTKKHRENQKKQKNLGFQGKVLGVTSPKSLGFFVFFGFLEFFCFFVFFCVFWFARVFFDFSNDFSEVFSEVLPFGLFITDFAQTTPFPQNFARAAPQHVCNIFSKANSFFISLLLGKNLLK